MATKTEIIFFLIFFYAILGVIISLIGTSLNEDITGDSETKSLGSFSLGNIYSGFAVMGATFNSVFFGSFIILITWIIASSLPTFNGGG